MLFTSVSPSESRYSITAFILLTVLSFIQQRSSNQDVRRGFPNFVHANSLALHACDMLFHSHHWEVCIYYSYACLNIHHILFLVHHFERVKYAFRKWMILPPFLPTAHVASALRGRYSTPLVGTFLSVQLCHGHEKCLGGIFLLLFGPFVVQFRIFIVLVYENEIVLWGCLWTSNLVYLGFIGLQGWCLPYRLYWDPWF